MLRDQGFLSILGQFTDQPLNILSDPSYTVYLTQKTEATSVCSTIEFTLLQLFLKLQKAYLTEWLSSLSIILEPILIFQVHYH